MRRARIKADGGGYYHCMSRIIERRQILDEAEKARLYKLMRDLAAFGGLEVLTYCFMSNHFHILLHAPERLQLSDEEFLQRLACILEEQEVSAIKLQLEDFQKQGQAAAAAALRARFTYRMYDV